MEKTSVPHLIECFGGIKNQLTVLNELRGGAQSSEGLKQFAGGRIDKPDERETGHRVELVEALAHRIEDVDLPEDEVRLQDASHRLVLPKVAIEALTEELLGILNIN